MLARAFKRQRNGSCGGVAELIDVDDDAVFLQPQPVRGRHDDAAVGLVGNEQGHVTAFEAVAREHRLRGLRHLADSVLEYRLPILMHVMHLLVHGLMAGRIAAASAGHI